MNGLTNDSVVHHDKAVKKYALIDTERQALIGHADIIVLFNKEHGDLVIQMKVPAEDRTL